MSRKARIQFDGALYHVFKRGIDRRDLFRDDRDRAYFVDCLELRGGLSLAGWAEGPRFDSLG